MIYRGFRRQAQHSASSRDRRHPLRRLVCCRPFPYGFEVVAWLSGCNEIREDTGWARSGCGHEKDEWVSGRRTASMADRGRVGSHAWRVGGAGFGLLWRL